MIPLAVIEVTIVVNLFLRTALESWCNDREIGKPMLEQMSHSGFHGDLN